MAAGIWATLSVPFWLLSYAGILMMPDNFDILLWHQHEMLYGFAGAAMTGFILTAIPNWTGRLSIRGASLGLLVSLWILGRIGFLTTATIGPLATAVFDLPFLIVLVLAIVREIISGKLEHVPTTLLDTFPKLAKLYKGVDSHPKVQEWISLKYPKKYTS